MTGTPDPHAPARGLIDSESTMALATAGKDGAWAAPVYYVFFQGALYFFSDPDSRHIRESLESGQAAATIYPFVSSWQDIRGLQMPGRIRKVRPGLSLVCRRGAPIEGLSIDRVQLYTAVFGHVRLRGVGHGRLAFAVDYGRGPRSVDT